MSAGNLFSDSVLHLQGWENDSALLCQTVDIFTGCLHSAESYFKTVVSEEPNACYFCCLWASTLLDTVGSLSLFHYFFNLLSLFVLTQCLPAWETVAFHATVNLYPHICLLCFSVCIVGYVPCVFACLCVHVWWLLISLLRTSTSKLPTWGFKFTVFSLHTCTHAHAHTRKQHSEFKV